MYFFLEDIMQDSIDVVEYSDLYTESLTEFATDYVEKEIEIIAINVYYESVTVSIYN